VENDVAIKTMAILEHSKENITMKLIGKGKSVEDIIHFY
jgi:hypothetical protein